jgi:hypothetical protein
VIYCRPDCALSPTCFFPNPQVNCRCFYTKVYFNSIPTIHKKYRKQNNQLTRKLVRQIILEINSLDTSELSIFSSPFTFSYLCFFNKCGHRNVLSKRQVWMSIFHIINFKKIIKKWTQGSWIF